VVLAVTLFLNILCEKGFSEISWLIVLLAFIFIVIILLNKLGCEPYCIPANNMPVMVNEMPINNTINYVPANNNMPIIHNYEHIPFGTNDPAYQSL
jgi:hypothetical protein